MEPSKKLYLDFSYVKKNTQIISFFICFLVAGIIWTINTLNKEHESSFTIKLDYPKLGSKLYFHGIQINEINLTITGKGFDLAEYFLFNHKDVIEVNTTNLIKINNGIYAADLLLSAMKQFNGKIKITKIFPESLSISNGKTYYKKVALKPTYRFNFKKLYVVSGPAVTVPDSLLLSSNLPIPDSIKVINTVPIEQDNVSDFVFRSTIPDLKKIPNLIADKIKIWVLVPVELSTECILQIPITSDESTRYLKFIPNSITVKCRVPLSKFEQTVPELFKANAKLDPNGTSKAIISLTFHPAWADQISWKPASVDYFHQNP